MALTFTDEAANAQLDAVVATVGTSGFVDFYSSNSTLLAHLALSATPFGAAASRTITAAAITADSSADANGTAVSFKITKANGTEVFAGTVAISGADCNLANNVTTVGEPVTITSMVITYP